MLVDVIVADCNEQNISDLILATVGAAHEAVTPLQGRQA